MRIEGLTMPPLNTTLMGVVRGVLDFYGIEVSDACAFGMSGHAFLVNIHEVICPSGPYCWDYTGFQRLLRNLGLQMKDLGFYSPDSSQAERARVERELRELLDRRQPCSLLNLENQIITGYDDDGFFTVQPWAPKLDFPPARLSFGTWEDLGEEYHVTFFTFEKRMPADARPAIIESLEFAAGIYEDPSKYSMPDYGIGPDAYANWKAAVDEHGASHGNWWNAMVWSECRAMASEYLAEISRSFTEVSEPALELSSVYAEIADLLKRVSDREMPAGEKLPPLEQAESMEAEVVEAIAGLAETRRAAGAD
jgi:hypothetical protein